MARKKKEKYLFRFIWDVHPLDPNTRVCSMQCDYRDKHFEIRENVGATFWTVDLWEKVRQDLVKRLKKEIEDFKKENNIR